MKNISKKNSCLEASKTIADPTKYSVRSAPPDTHVPASIRELDRLIPELLMRFVKISVEQIDSEIREFVQKIADALGLDRCSLYQAFAGGTRLLCTHRWATPGGEPVSVCPGPANAPWVYRKIIRGETIAFSGLQDLPEEAAKEKEYFRGTGTKSLISLPMEFEDVLIGALVMESVRSEKYWPDELTPRLMMAADVFASALERKRRKLELMQKLRLEMLLTDISARFVMLEPVEIDQEIEKSLREIGQLVSADRCGILEVHSDKKISRVTHAWYGEGIERVPPETNLFPLFPWSHELHITKKESFNFTTLDELPPEAEKDRQAFAGMGVRSSLVIPIFCGKIVYHFIVFQNLLKERVWPGDYLPRIRQLGEIFVNALNRKDAEVKLRKSFDEIRSLKEKIQAEADFLRNEIKLSQTHEKIIGQSESLVKVLKLVEQVAPTDSTVLICGETGTGKELIARAIHNLSPYSDKIMVKVNCASLPAPLVESELFGREKGAYTGALTRQIGRFEMADGSTIFLDEIAELSLDLQAKLLRVLQEGQFERLGSPRTIQVHVRVIAATNRNLVEEVKKGNFREDLYYRLNVFPITVPPLRERLDDIPILVWTFVNEFSNKMGKQINKIAKRDMEALQRYSWPGNIRELRNVIEHAVIISNGDTLVVKAPRNDGNGSSGIKTLEEIESLHITDVLRHTGGRIKGPYGAARILGMNPSTLYSRIQKLGIKLHDEKGEISS
ncbi:MAG TPA: sigma 54-interacting transcriptional regulator [Geobacteraceae bacterium]|nr:sigma 54-interacting transcriptional regulator [Geobacteraceae bacterium]